MPPLFKWYYLAEILAGIAALAHLTRASTYLSLPDSVTTTRGSLFQTSTLDFAFVFYHIPLVISLTISLIITWKYWGWLIKDRKQ